jgi:hypothetical protein
VEAHGLPVPMSRLSVPQGIDQRQFDCFAATSPTVPLRQRNSLLLRWCRHPR